VDLFLSSQNLVVSSTPALFHFREVAQTAKPFITNTVYVEGLPYEAQEKDLTNFFKKCGEIQGVRLPRSKLPVCRTFRKRFDDHLDFLDIKIVVDAEAMDMSSSKQKSPRKQQLLCLEAI